MGIDIHAFVVDDINNTVVASNILGFGYRNYDFFQKLQKDGSDPLYWNLPTEYMDDSDLPESLKLEYEGCWGLRKMTLTAYNQWCWERRPWEKCGWVSKKDEYYYKYKGILPEEVYDSTLDDPKGHPAEEFSFLVFQDNTDPFLYLSDILFKDLKLTKHGNNWDGYSFVYFFDC
jgi:hypothetical protein